MRKEIREARASSRAPRLSLGRARLGPGAPPSKVWVKDTKRKKVKAMRTKTDPFKPAALLLCLTRHLRRLPAVHIILSPPSALELCTRSSGSVVIFMLKPLSLYPAPSPEWPFSSNSPHGRPRATSESVHAPTREAAETPDTTNTHR